VKRLAVRRRRLGRGTAAALAILAGTAGLLRADLLELKGEDRHEGLFLGFKQEKFQFQTADGKTLRVPRVAVEGLSLAPPANVIVKPRGKSKREDLKLVGYDRAGFRFTAGGQPLTLPSAGISFIALGLDFNRPVAPAAAETVSGNDPEFEVEELVQPGRATVIHFHLPAAMSSVRQGHYLAERAADLKGRLRLVKVELSDFESPAARRCGIASAPQFWLYDAEGRLVRKLVDRFTEEDIDRALQEVLR